MTNVKIAGQLHVVQFSQFDDKCQTYKCHKKCLHYILPFQKCRQLKILIFESRSRYRRTIFALTPFDGKCQKSTNVSIIFFFCASFYRFIDITVLHLCPSKGRYRSWKTIFAMTPFDGKYQNFRDIKLSKI